MADMVDMLRNFAQNFSSNCSNQQQNQYYNSPNEEPHSNNSSNNGSSQEENPNFEMPNIDFETMMKISKIMSALQSNQNSNSANLLRAMKPYLNHSRQEKVDEYIKLLNIEQIISAMNNFGGDSSNGPYS